MTCRRLAVILAVLAVVAMLGLGVLGFIVVQRFWAPPPAARIASPEAGALFTAGDNYTIVVRAEAGAARLELWVDGAPLRGAANPQPKSNQPWEAPQQWQATTPGPHALIVRAYDANGRVSISAPLTVTVVPPGMIAFTSNRTGYEEIYTMRTDGGDLRQLTRNGLTNREPAWSRTGALAYASTQRAGDLDIWRMAADGSGASWLTTSSASDYAPAWSPDGRLAFVSNRDGGEDIYLMDGNGANQTRLTRDGFAGQPTWSPDGQRLAFTSSRGAAWDINVIGATGSSLARLTSGGRNWFPAWSPQGDKVAFVSDREGTPQVWTMNTDGSAPVRRSDFPAGAEHPTWSPDGQWLIGVAATGEADGVNARELYLLKADGTILVRLTSNGFSDADPAWYWPISTATPQPTPPAPTAGFTGEYFANPDASAAASAQALTGIPTLVRADPAIDFDWGTGSPDPRLPADGFAVRWTGTISVTGDGAYTFAVTADNGVRLWVAGALLVDQWRDQAVTTHQATRYLGVGEHQVKLEYYQRSGPATVRLRWGAMVPTPTVVPPTAAPTPPPTATPLVRATVLVDEREAGFQRGGPASNWREASYGYGQHMLWTRNTQSATSNWGRWTPALPGPGRYEVFVFIPDHYATTTAARYRLTHAGRQDERVVNQSLYNNQWFSLGTYDFDGKGGESVYLSDQTTERNLSRYIGFDAVKFEPR